MAALSCMVVASSAVAGNAAGAQPADDAPPACYQPTRTGPPPTSPGPTTVTTLEQAYYCIFANYYAGPVLNDEVLLLGAFAGMTQELDVLGDDRADATMPALTGDRDSDWTALGTVYQNVVNELPNDPTLRQEVAAATMNGMVSALHDNHARWGYPAQQPPGYQSGDSDGLGIVTSPAGALATISPNEALPPLYISAVQGGPAAQAGLKPGDVIEAVDGSAPFVDGEVSPGAISLLNEQYPDEQPVRITLWRPATDRTWTVTLTPALYTPTATANQPVTSELLSGDIAYVKLTQFAGGTADDVLNAIAALAAGQTLHGIILDVRGNGGGDPNEVATLLGAFEHGEAPDYIVPLTAQDVSTGHDPDVAKALALLNS
jgi:carboxyl-terminal processing protease